MKGANQNSLSAVGLNQNGAQCSLTTADCAFNHPHYTNMQEKEIAGNNPELGSICRTTGVAEKVTQQEQAEEMAFLNAVAATPPMLYVHQYLARKVCFFAA